MAVQQQADAYRISYEDLDERLTKAKAFIWALFYVDLAARTKWGAFKGKALPYDPHYKGLMEVLVDDDDLMCGFKVHWPNDYLVRLSPHHRRRRHVQLHSSLLKTPLLN